MMLKYRKTDPLVRFAWFIGLFEIEILRGGGGMETKNKNMWGSAKMGRAISRTHTCDGRCWTYWDRQNISFCHPSGSQMEYPLLKDGLAVDLSKETCEGGLFFLHNFCPRDSGPMVLHYAHRCLKSCLLLSPLEGMWVSIDTHNAGP